MTDFHDAHLRHFEDAEYLHGGERWANSDHLFGVSAECGLKRLMQAFGMRLASDSSGPELREDKVHVNKIWERYERYRSGCVQGVNYSLMTIGTPLPFDDWDVSQRYTHRNNFKKETLENHRQAARKVWEMLKRAKRDGLI